MYRTSCGSCLSRSAGMSSRLPYARAATTARVSGPAKATVTSQGLTNIQSINTVVNNPIIREFVRNGTCEVTVTSQD